MMRAIPHRHGCGECEEAVAVVRKHRERSAAEVAANQVDTVIAVYIGRGHRVRVDSDGWRGGETKGAFAIVGKYGKSIIVGICTDQIDVTVTIDIGSCNRSEEHTSELQSQSNLVCRLLLEKKKKKKN